MHGWSKKHNYRIPMALANDNFIGYTTDLIPRFKVRWLEAAIVTPVWTSVLIYYVEGDHGHLFNEELGRQQSRTVVRGGWRKNQGDAFTLNVFYWQKGCSPNGS